MGCRITKPRTPLELVFSRGIRIHGDLSEEPQPTDPSSRIGVYASGQVWDDVDYPNCPTLTVTWQYVRNGVTYSIGSKTIALIPSGGETQAPTHDRARTGEGNRDTP